MAQWKDWVPVDMLQMISQHVIGTLAILLSLGLIHVGVGWAPLPQDLRWVILLADEFLAVAVVFHLLAHFAAYLWKNLPKFYVFVCS